jgi:subtilisin-like proprotein convertase family protein
MASTLRRTLTLMMAGLTGTGVMAGSAIPAQAKPQPHSTIRHEAHHDNSSPLASIAPQPLPDENEARSPVRLKIMPNRGLGKHADQMIQAAVGPGGPAVRTGFDGLGEGFTGPAGSFDVTSIPPDTNAAVGTTQIVEIVNTGFAVFNKDGTVVYGPAATNTLFTGFGGPCETTNDGDGVVRFDTLANRWVLTQFAIDVAATPYYECVAVSQTADATGAWNRYAFPFVDFPDYPKLAVWPDAYYITYNLFGADFLGAEVCAMDRAAMLAGTAATQQCFTTSDQYGGLLAADLQGGAAPPAGAPNTLLALGTTATSLAYWKFHVDWADPANTTFTGPSRLDVAAFTPACGDLWNCVPQPGSNSQLDTISDRLMYSLSYRNFGDHEAVVANHAVTAGNSVGVRWYELRDLSGTPTVYQQGTFAPDSTYRWMGSIGLDKNGNIGLGYSAGSATTYPGIRVTGRLAGDPLGTMTQGDTPVRDGTGSQTGYSRWGDYSSMSVDPVDGCTFWYAQEFLKTTGNFNWSTHLHSFTLPGCGDQPTDFALSVSPASGTVSPGTSVTTTVNTAPVEGGTAGPVSFSVSGLPTGATAALNPPSVIAGGSSTLTLTASPLVLPGTYPITVNGTGASMSTSATYTLTVNAPTGACYATSNTDVTILDNATAESPITIANCPGKASVSGTVEVHIVHTYVGDLVVSLVAPDGTVYQMRNRTGGDTDNIDTVYVADLSGEVANGTWKLRVTDAAAGNHGYIDGWSLNLAGSASACSGTNNRDITIKDNTTVNSPVRISRCSGNASTLSIVDVHIVHTYVGDLVVSLVAPDGTVYLLRNRTGDNTDNIDEAYVLDLSGKARNGTWNLRVQDARTGDTGYIDSWTLRL